MLTTATIGDKKHVLKLKFDDSREWVFNLPSNGVVDKWSKTVREKICERTFDTYSVWEPLIHTVYGNH